MKLERVGSARLGGWLPRDPKAVEHWIRKLKKRVTDAPQPLIPPIAELQQMVASDPVLSANVTAMFAEAYLLQKNTPLDWEPEPQTFETFLLMLNAIMTTAPEAYQTGTGGNQQPAGLIGFPINALLDWPMATSFGYAVFSNELVNQQFKKILAYWSTFLVSEASRYVLTQSDPSSDAIAWLSEAAQAEMVSVATSALGPPVNMLGLKFEDIFNCDPKAPFYGFKSWDDFFTRTFKDGMRPVAGVDDDNIIVNACESAPLAVTRNVALSDSFWLKGQPYSLENMLNWDDYTPQFEGGTVYQAFLSALSYHRWHSPVSGTIKKAYVVNGSYYLENLYQGFLNPSGADPAAPNNSQPFLTAVATRAIIFIEADNPAIGLMCVVPVGMAEVSSCEITVQPGQRVKKGDQLGMFHFGGSTHCLIFRPGVNLSFTEWETPGLNANYNIGVNAQLAVVNAGKEEQVSSVINVTACDNELIIMAYQWGASYQLCRILSGNENSVNVTLNIKAGPYRSSEPLNGVNQPLNTTLPVYLPVGDYSLMLLGIDWGGPAQFTVAVNDQQYALPRQASGDGLVFHPNPIPLKVRKAG